jgi:hypothetical protein
LLDAVVARRAVADVLRERRLSSRDVGVVVVLWTSKRAHVDLVDVVRQVADRAAVDDRVSEVNVLIAPSSVKVASVWP